MDDKPLERRMFFAGVQFGISVPEDQGVDEVAFGEIVERAIEQARQDGAFDALSSEQVPVQVNWVSFVGLEDTGSEPPESEA